MRSAEAFDDAWRHTRMVKLLRVLTPATAFAAVAATAAVAILQPLSSEIHVDTAGIEVGGASVAMDQPRMRGFNSQDRAYEVSARTAHQTIAEPNRIGLDDLAARIDLAGGGWAQLTSPNGLYDAGTQVLNLDQAVRVISDKGDDARLTSARAEMKTGRIVSERPVEIELGGSRLTADRMEVLNSGDRMLFGGHVRMTLRRDGKDRATPAPAAAPEPAPVPDMRPQVP